MTLSQHIGRRSSLSAGEVDRLLGWMPFIVRAPGIADRDRQFAISIVGQHRRNPAFTPSPKQAAWMSRLVREFLAAMLTENAGAS